LPFIDEANVIGSPDISAAAHAERRVTVPAGAVSMSADEVTTVGDGVGVGVGVAAELSFLAQPIVARIEMLKKTATPQQPAIRVRDVIIASP
jgi:hypothetical protein